MQEFVFPRDVRGWLTEEEGRLLYNLAKLSRDAIEVGAFCGRSTFCLSQAANRVLTVDPFDGRGVPGVAGENTLPEFLRNRDALKVRDVVRYVQDTIEGFAERSFVGSGWNFHGNPYGLAFVDGAHDAAAVRSNLFAVSRFLRPGAVYAVHDYGNPDFPGVREACDTFFGGRPAAVVDHLALFSTADRVPAERVLWLITPCSRVDLLPACADSVRELWREGLEVRWVVVFDPRAVKPDAAVVAMEMILDGVVHRAFSGRQGTGGHYGALLRNQALAVCEGGWCAFLDDDNVMKPEFVRELYQLIVADPEAQGFVCDQTHKTGELRLTARPGAGLCEVDTAQFAFRRDLIKNTTWEPDRYDADGAFYLAVRAMSKAGMRYVNKPLATYNALR